MLIIDYQINLISDRIGCMRAVRCMVRVLSLPLSTWAMTLLPFDYRLVHGSPKKYPAAGTFDLADYQVASKLINQPRRCAPEKARRTSLAGPSLWLEKTFQYFCFTVKRGARGRPIDVACCRFHDDDDDCAWPALVQLMNWVRPRGLLEVCRLIRLRQFLLITWWSCVRFHDIVFFFSEGIFAWLNKVVCRFDSLRRWRCRSIGSAAEEEKKLMASEFDFARSECVLWFTSERFLKERKNERTKRYCCCVVYSFVSWTWN